MDIITEMNKRCEMCNNIRLGISKVPSVSECLSELIMKEKGYLTLEDVHLCILGSGEGWVRSDSIGVVLDFDG